MHKKHVNQWTFGKHQGGGENTKIKKKCNGLLSFKKRF